MKEKVKRKLDNFFEKIVELYIYWANNLTYFIYGINFVYKIL